MKDLYMLYMAVVMAGRGSLIQKETQRSIRAHLVSHKREKSSIIVSVITPYTENCGENLQAVPSVI